MSSQTQSFRLPATRSSGVLVPWKTQIASALGFSSCPSDHMSGVWIHTAATCSAMRIWHLGPVTPRPTFLFFYIYAPPTSRALTVSRASNKPSRNAWNAKLPSMNVDNAAENSPSLQLPDVLVPSSRENSVGAVFVSWPLPPASLTARTCACFQCGVDEAGEGDVALQDHVSAHHLAPSAIASEF